MRARFTVVGLHFEAQWSPSGLQALRLLPKNISGHRTPTKFSKQERCFLRILRHTLRQFLRNRSTPCDIPLDWSGATDFQKAVWRELQKIPRGETRSYSEIARRMGQPRAARAVGAACAANPILLLVPCHRVIASNGSLGGFSGGRALKQILLKREGIKAPQAH